MNSQGISHSEIDRLERSINRKLPDWYKAFLSNYPNELVNLGAPYNTVSKLSLPNDVDRLIQISDYGNSPNNILVIGVDGLGNFYYVILSDHDTRIYLFNHEDPSFIDGNENEIDWKRSYDHVFDNMDELINHLKETLRESDDSIPSDGEPQSSEISVVIESEMKDRWQENRNLAKADSYPYSINNSEVARLLMIEASLFEEYPSGHTISYFYLVSVDKNGEIIKADFQGGSNMRFVNDVNENIKLLKFKPGIRNNAPVDSYTMVSYTFQKH